MRSEAVSASKRTTRPTTIAITVRRLVAERVRQRLFRAQRLQHRRVRRVVVDRAIEVDAERRAIRTVRIHRGHRQMPHTRIGNHVVGQHIEIDRGARISDRDIIENQEVSIGFRVRIEQKWLRLFEQNSPIYKWIPGGLITAKRSPWL